VKHFDRLFLFNFVFRQEQTTFFLPNLLPVKTDIGTIHAFLIDSSGQITISFEMIRARPSENQFHKNKCL